MIAYQRITGTPFTIDSTFDVVFLALPNRPLQASETTALLTLLQSGSRKRIVLVGEYAYYSDYMGGLNVTLNAIASSLGIHSQFSTSASLPIYDNHLDYYYSCRVEPYHYLRLTWFTWATALPIAL